MGGESQFQRDSAFVPYKIWRKTESSLRYLESGDSRERVVRFATEIDVKARTTTRLRMKIMVNNLYWRMKVERLTG